MMRTLVQHARRHIIACLAFVCSVLALAGSAYAGLQIPAGSVGERQLQNKAIDPVKWAPDYVTGFVRRWATVGASGSILATSPDGQSKATATGNVVVTWGDAFAGWCAPLATVKGGSASAPTSTTTTTTTPSTTSTTTTPTTTSPVTTPTTSTTITAPVTSTISTNPTTNSSSTSSSSSTTTTTTTTQQTPSGGGYADASIVTRSGQSTLVAVATYNSLGQPAALPFSVAVVCGPGAGSGQSFPTNLP